MMKINNIEIEKKLNQFIIKIIFFIFLLINSFILKQSAFSQVPFRSSVSPSNKIKPSINITAKLFDKNIRKLSFENTKKKYPQSLSKNNSELIKEKTDYNIGDKKKFWAYDYSTYSSYEVEATLLQKGSVANIWVDTTELLNGHVTLGDLYVMLNTLENHTPSSSKDSTKGIISLDKQFFGNPPNINSQLVKGQGNGRIDYLILDIMDGFDPNSSPGYSAGYFDPNDQSFYPYGNRRDILYIDTYPSIFFEGKHNLNMALQTMAHELQHLIHFNYDPEEIRFITEACSMNAEIICGFNAFSDLKESDYLDNTNRSLFSWSDGDIPQDYSRAALWMLYSMEQIGDNFPAALVQNPQPGIYGVNSAIGALGYSLSFSQLLKNWAIANYLNNRNYNSAYGYKYNINGKPKGLFLKDPNQKILNRTIAAYASDYFFYTKSSKNFKFTFTSNSSNIYIRMIAKGKNKTNVLDIQFNNEYSIPEFETEYDTIAFAITNSGNQNSAISVSSSGYTFISDEEISYDDGSVKIIDGVSFLYFNVIEDGCAVKFIPRYIQNKLTTIKLWLAFGQELTEPTNPPTPANAPKRFIVHIWDMGPDSLPGKDLIQPFIHLMQARPNTFPNDFVTIDLGNQSELINLKRPVFVGFTEDDAYYSYIAINNLYSENYSYTLQKNVGGWVSMDELYVPGKSGNNIPLKGWNLMIRAKFEYQPNGITHIIEEKPAFELKQNYPNPFNPETSIEYIIPKACPVKLIIYDVLGRKIKELVNDFQITGKYKVTWNGENEKGIKVSSGIYFYKIETGEFSQIKKLNLLK